MHFQRLSIPDLVLVEPKVWGDARGFFFESFRADLFDAFLSGEHWSFVQDNHSSSVRGVLRGIHYQLPPKAQGKLVRVIAGEIFDVAVDLRAGSPTLGRWVGEHLSAENKRQLWIPPGFGHGFLTLSDNAEILYKATDLYAPAQERCVLWNDPDLAIAWPLAPGSEPILSPKDEKGLLFREADLFPLG